MTLTISGLRVNVEYDLALFGVDSHTLGGRRGATFTIAGYGSKSTTASNLGLDSNSFSEGTTHVRFHDVTADSAGEIVVTITPEPGITDICVCNGFQIGQLPCAGTLFVVR